MKGPRFPLGTNLPEFVFTSLIIWIATRGVCLAVLLSPWFLPAGKKPGKSSVVHYEALYLYLEKQPSSSESPFLDFLEIWGSDSVFLSLES